MLAVWLCGCVAVAVAVAVAVMGVTLCSWGFLCCRQSRFLHPYPLGYQAYHYHWGKRFDMTISSVDGEPQFEVRCGGWMRMAGHAFVAAAHSSGWTAGA